MAQLSRESCLFFAIFLSEPFLTKKYLCNAKGKQLRQKEDEIGRFSNHVEFCLILANFDQPMFWKGQTNFLKSINFLVIRRFFQILNFAQGFLCSQKRL